MIDRESLHTLPREWKRQVAALERLLKYEIKHVHHLRRAFLFGQRIDGEGTRAPRKEFELEGDAYIRKYLEKHFSEYKHPHKGAFLSNAQTNLFMAGAALSLGLHRFKKKDQIKQRGISHDTAKPWRRVENITALFEGLVGVLLLEKNGETKAQELIRSFLLTAPSFLLCKYLYLDTKKAKDVQHVFDVLKSQSPKRSLDEMYILPNGHVIITRPKKRSNGSVLSAQRWEEVTAGRSTRDSLRNARTALFRYLQRYPRLVLGSEFRRRVGFWGR